MFFSMFPSMQIEIDGQFISYPDIFRRVGKNKFLENQMYLDRYTVTDGEKPEHIAHRLYGNPQYHWIILLTNNIIDVYHDWPQSTHDLVDATKAEYGANSLSDVHHYEFVGEDRIQVDYDADLLAAGTIRSISNYDHNVRKNESKAEISLLKPEYVLQFVGQFKQLIKK